MRITTHTDLDYESRTALLDEQFSLNKPRIVVENINQEILNLPFESEIHRVMPRETDVITENPAFLALMNYYLGRSEASDEHIFKKLAVSDRDIPENNRFVYPFIKPRGVKECREIIILFHGLNEKTWNKYLPWASSLAESTGRGVVLFPIAFHMNRAPASWSALRPMMQVAKERKQLLPDIQGASFANTAISHRLQFAPQRFLLSGIQTYHDVLQLMETIRRGKHPGIAAEAKVDIFGYSIGATLSEILLMANSQGLFSDSRAFLFCGGSALDRMTPVNKAIIDNHAFKSIILYFTRLLKEKEGKESLIGSLVSRSSGCFEYFKSILLYDELREKREGRFMEICRRIKTVTLRKDIVISPEAISTTLGGRYGDIPMEMETLDFPFSYSHEVPFPRRGGEEVDTAFKEVLHRAAAFLSAS